MLYSSANVQRLHHCNHESNTELMGYPQSLWWRLTLYIIVFKYSVSLTIYFLSFRLKDRYWMLQQDNSLQTRQPSVQSTGGTCRTNTTTRMSCCSVSSSGLMEGCYPGESLACVQRNITRLPSVCRWLKEQVCCLTTNPNFQRATSQKSPSHNSTDTWPAGRLTQWNPSTKVD